MKRFALSCFRVFFYCLGLCLIPFPSNADSPKPAIVSAIIFAEKPDIASLRALGPGVLPVMANLYSGLIENDRARMAWAFYELGWKSQEAEQALMQDVYTHNQNLRLQVQWALGRVSNDPEVVDVLLKNMKFDQNPLFRDKAACALANDQIHLNGKQKVRLFEGVIGGLESPNPQVREISIQVLRIQTGQEKGFNAHASESERASAISGWKQWLEEYRSSL